MPDNVPDISSSYLASRDAREARYDRSLRRLLRRPAIAEHLNNEITRLGVDHVVVDADGQVLAGDAQSQAGPACPITADGRNLGSVYGRHAASLCQWLELLAQQDHESRALGNEALNRYREVTMLYALSDKIVGQNDSDIIAKLVCQESALFLRCDSTAVLLLNPETNRLEITATFGPPFHDRAAREVEDDIIASVLRTGVAEIVNDVSAEPRSLAARNALQSVICSPLKSHDWVFGVLVAGSERQREFNAGELQALNSIASHAAASIEAIRLAREIKSKSSKPAAVIFAVGERPPWTTTLLLAMQHILIALISLAYPVLVALEAGASPAVASAVVSISLLAMAVATALQSLGKGLIGSGYLAPCITSAIFLGPSLMAARVGGLALVAGMTIFAGVTMLVLSRFMLRFRKLFPPEVSGVVVLMVGITIVPVALPRALGAGADGMAWAVGLLTLSLIVLMSVLPFRRIRLYATAIAMGLGYATALALDVFDMATAESIKTLPILRILDLPVPGLDFAPALIVPFVAASLASSIKEAGLLTSVQKANDAQWRRPNMASVSGGLVASGLGNVFTGALGGVGVGIGAGNIGLAAATGAMSRSIGVVVAALFALLAFMPKFTAILAAIPAPVMGAGLLFVACHLVVSGAELITSRMLDARRNYIVGLPLLAGIGMMTVPGLFEDAPSWMQPVLSSSLALSTILVLTLNLFLNAGVSNRAQLRLAIDSSANEVISRFFERQGALWGARPDVIRRAGPATTEWCEDIRQIAGPAHADIEMEFDEFQLTTTIFCPQLAALLADGRTADARESLARIASAIERRYECRPRLSDDGSMRLDFEH